MRARYIGDPRNDGDGPSSLELFDRVWPKFKWLPIDAIPPKMEGNWHFQIDRSDTPCEVEETQERGPSAYETHGVQASVPVPFGEDGKPSLKPVDPFDHDKNGAPGGSLPEAQRPNAERIAAMRAEITALNGKQPHHSAGLAKVEEALQAAREQAAFLAENED